ncbi:MAG: bifunctional acetate--CoA ligase family protein/GNAT family N-acetyltransferase [Chloroflexota bacterium]
MTTKNPPINAIEALFSPKNIAVIGASERFPSIGYTILTNLLEHQSDRAIYPVNLRRKTVLGLKAYSAIQSVPGPVDLAVIATPAATVPSIVHDCAKQGVKAAIIISAGFKEVGASGIRLEKQILNAAQQGQMRIVGPNCFGIMNPHLGLNATIATTMAHAGSVGFISQSGAFDAAILDWSLQESIGFSTFISLGSMLDIGWGEAISTLGQDPNTKSILIYMESIGDARSFLSAARKVALDKPIIVLKAGRTEAAAKAVTSHIGTITTRDDVLDAALRRVGVLRVDQMAHLFYMAEVLAKQPRPKGPNLTILTNAGGPGILASDALIQGNGQLAPLSEKSLKQLNTFLPNHWSKANPIDILGDAGPLRYVKALDVATQDSHSDGILLVLTPQDQTAPTQTAREIKKLASRTKKPVLASWMGGADVEAGRAILRQANIPTFDYPDTAARIFNYMWQYSRNLRSLYEIPTLTTSLDDSPDQTWVTQMLDTACDMNREMLTEFESKQLLAAYGIPAVETYLASEEVDAVTYADEIGYPVVLKLHSATIAHKSDVGGVHLNLVDALAVRNAYQAIRREVGDVDFLGVTVQPMLHLSGYELFLGSKIDPDFGVVLLFGTGGKEAQIFQDFALGLPPLTSTLARRMMASTQIYQHLRQISDQRGLDLDMLSQVLVRFGQLVIEQPQISEIDINPLWISANQLVVLDANIHLHSAKLAAEDLPRPVIRPYPAHYIFKTQLKNKTAVTIRPIRPEDEPLIADFHETLSDTSVYYRYFQMIPLTRRIDHDRLSRVCFIDYDQEIALVVEYRDTVSDTREILGVGRLVKQGDQTEAEFAVLVSDNWQRQGIGGLLLQKLIDIAHLEGQTVLFGKILPENYGMLALCKAFKFETQHLYDEGVVEARLTW